RAAEMRPRKRAAPPCVRASRGMPCSAAPGASSVALSAPPLFLYERAVMSLRILLVDDHAVVRQGVRQLLMDRGVALEVGEAETGAEALAAVDKHAYDVVLLDISLPDMNG